MVLLQHLLVGVFCFAALLLSHPKTIAADDCVEPTGICFDKSLDPSCVYNISELEAASFPLGRVFLRGIILINVVYGNHDDLFETAIAFRQAAYTATKRYNTLAAYNDVALEFFAREDVTNQRRRCQPDINDEDAVILFEYHRGVADAYTLYYIYLYNKPTRLDDVFPIFQSFGIDPNICDSIACGDDVSTPWGLAYAIAEEMKEYAKYDGWNELGDYNREYNRIPFSDWRGEDTRYEAKNAPWDLEYIENWQPLLESDEYGFLYYQEHSVPHVGYTGKSLYYSNDEFCDAPSAPEPDYDYEEEIELALNRLASLTEKQKVEVEYFDAKANLLPLFGIYYGQLGFNTDTWEYVQLNVAAIHSWYEAVLRVWKAKVDFDRVRPTSIVHELLGDTEITSYAGTTPDGETYGTQTFSANDWEPYIRTMPHAEYPSGSACVCKAWAQAMITITGTDEFEPILGRNITRTISAFSSDYEPLSTPSSDITLEYSSWSNIANRCGYSRLEGGMHFTAAVPAGFDLCEDIGTRVAESILALGRGEKPEFSVDFYDTEIVERDCYPDNDSSDDSDSSDSSDSDSDSSDSSDSSDDSDD